MKDRKHLPVYGVGPLCVYLMAGLLLGGILLCRFGVLDSGRVPALRIPMMILGGLLIALGVYMWIRAVLVDKVGKDILENHLRTTGIYAWVRNPIYSAAALVCTGTGFFWGNLWFLLLPLLCWLDITILMKCTEEKWLLNLYGEEYTAYCRRVNRCIPWFPGKAP